jgi:hypothetical protein
LQLKEALTERKRKPRHQEIRHYEKYRDADLEKFANSLTIEPGPSLKDQRADVDTTESVRSASAIGGPPIAAKSTITLITITVRTNRSQDSRRTGDGRRLRK